MSHPVPYPSPRRTGFTLIELSIVLVVIGLIVGGVLSGRDLIEAAKIRSQVSELEKLSSATNTFYLKYGSIPGDIDPIKALQFGLSSCGNTCGSSSSALFENNLIQDFSNNIPIQSAWQKPVYFFAQLSDASLINGKYQYVPSNWLFGSGNQFPALATNNAAGIVVSSYLGTLWLFLGLSTGNTVNDHAIADLSTKGVLTAAQSYSIDSKIDDGVPSTGTVLAITLPQNLPTTDNTALHCVVDASAKAYNLNDSNLWCRLFVMMQ